MNLTPTNKSTDFTLGVNRCDLQKYEKDPVMVGGLRMHFRPILPADASALEQFFKSHSEQTILHRYLAHIGRLSPEQIRKFVTVDYHRDFALVGFEAQASSSRILCIGRYCQRPEATEAEFAITVHDDFQGRGLGTFLLKELVKIAAENGIHTFTASVMADNCAMMHIIHKISPKIATLLESGVYEVRFEIG